MALCERVQSGAEDDVLPNSACCVFLHELVEVAGARDGCAKRAGAGGIHVAAGTPVRIGIGQTHAHGVIEHVRRRIDLDVQSAPQCDANGRAVWC